MPIASPAEGDWRRCSACKQPIALGTGYWTCNVSTCNRKRTGLVFCSVSCWEMHLPIARHREAWAEEQTAPLEPVSTTPKPAAPTAKRPAKRTLVRSDSAGSNVPAQDAPEEVLIIGSRLKSYIRTRYGFNVSDRVLGPLSDIVRRACDEAAANARRDERKTVLDRDVPKPPR